MAAVFLMYTFPKFLNLRSSRSSEFGVDVNSLEGNTIFHNFLVLKLSSIFYIVLSQNGCL